MESLLAWLTQYGYAGLFGLLLLGILGLPIPDETLLVFCGYLIYRGRLNFFGAFISGFAGSLCGITLSYYLGLRFGRRVVERYGRYLRIRPNDVDKVSRWFQRIGYWLLTIGYFIPGVRHFTALVAGMSRLNFRAFACFAYPGAAIWVALFLTLGQIFGERWENTSKVVHRYTIIATLALAALAVIVWGVRSARAKWFSR
jgi:membrane protein DedA with SNARE-associated domain